MSNTIYGTPYFLV